MKNVLTIFFSLVLVIGLCSCFNRVVNGDFASETLSPGWTDCFGTFYGGVTSVNPCANTEYNLSLINDDCFEQELSRPITPTSPLTFWSACPGLDRPAGEFFARVYYSDGTSEGTPIPRTYNCDTKHTVPVDTTKQVTRVRFRTLGAEVHWYVTLVNLQGY